MYDVTEFTLTQDHLNLLNRMYINYTDSCYGGGPVINPKRPYGNSNIIGDLYEIVYGHSWDKEFSVGEYDPNVYNRLIKLHEETAIALQIVLCTLSFVPGKYIKENKYDSLSWKLVNE